MSDGIVPALQLNAQNTKDCMTSEEGQEQSAPLLARPEEILGDPTLSKAEGALVDVDDIYTALRVLDDFAVGIERGASSYASSTSWRPRRRSRWIGNFIRPER